MPSEPVNHPSGKTYIFPSHVVDAPKSINASQISQYIDCPRMWGFHYIGGIHATSPATAWGTQVHSMVEGLLSGWSEEDILQKYGDIKEGRPFEAAKKLAELCSPKREGRDIRIEERFKTEFEGYAMHGTIDYLAPSRNQAWIVDHKTTSNLKYVPDKSKLGKHPQVLLYMYYALKEFGGNEAVGHWNYVERGSLKMKHRVFAFGLDKAEKGLSLYLPVMEELVRFRGVERLHDLKPDTSSCFKYGGCPYKALCQGKGADILRKRKRSETMEDQLETNEMYAQLLGVTTQVGAQRRPEKQPAEQRPAVTETPRKHRLVLYVNGSVLKTPHGVQIIQLGEFISDCKKQVAAHYEKKEYRQVDYSHGVAELCYIVEQKVKALLERQDLHIELDSRTPEGSHLYNTLVDLSTSVFRGHV